MIKKIVTLSLLLSILNINAMDTAQNNQADSLQKRIAFFYLKGEKI